MKKISLLMCAVASLGILFTSCEKKQNTETPIDPNTLLTSGAYVVTRLPAMQTSKLKASWPQVWLPV